jgi:formate C-acetyltransferase
MTTGEVRKVFTQYRREAARDRLAGQRSTSDVIRDREELAEQIKALRELVEMAAAYGLGTVLPGT